MRYYFVTEKWMGNATTLEPRIPTHKDDSEESVTPRICVSSSILGCFIAIYPNIFDKMYIYYCDIDRSRVYVPSIKEVYDADFTGEQWILEPAIFKLYKKIEIKQSNMDLFIESIRTQRDMLNIDEEYDPYENQPIGHHIHMHLDPTIIKSKGEY